MDTQPDEARRGRPLSRGIAALPTGTKLFLILSAALLPLALIALFAARQTTQAVDRETRSQLRVAATESARALAIELVGDMNALRVALDALDADPADAPSCARVQGVFAEQLASGARLSISDRSGRVLCGTTRLPAIAVEPPPPGGPVTAGISPTDGLALALASPSGRLRATATFPATSLAQIARPSGFVPPYAAMLVRGNMRLPLEAMPELGALDRTETIGVPVGVDGLLFEMSVRSAPLSSPVIVAMLLPLLMWAAAAGIGWFVVDRLLIRPLRDLRLRVATYVPGEEIDSATARQSSTQEIRDLGDTFREISRTVASHEAGLAQGLLRQTALTREVHHRVKNNLQVISSLINFHARGARSEEASAAYASIQRRVDALAVVHRNHFAEADQARGLSLRAVIGDLASNIRATAPEGSGLSITLDLESYLATQDVATAVAFLITELIELAMRVRTDAAMRVSLKPGAEPGKAVVRISSPALVDSDRLRAEIGEGYGRVVEGLSRQLRSKLHHDPMVGAFEIPVNILGRD
ncbi:MULTISPECIES: sensor histidine kinase [Sphingomonas]|uniref:sensor histidine kinase n=1 Tax=Sphingomonas TaxID=13687 RepID=UPI00082E460D|nr:histidine kinase dimerization/phosphoacceptor domain -containing protein [Sphingomonas sp. CCH10-B3]